MKPAASASLISESDFIYKGQQPAPVNQDYYLAGGKLRPWAGEMERIYSPIHGLVNGEIAPILLGSIPKLDAENTLSVLEAALMAYNKGQGTWAVSKTADRIEALEQFKHRMLHKRYLVVERMMWEIAKNRIDSENEFDRTIDYISDTIEALKQLDNESSRFVKHQGIVAQIRRSPLGVVLCMAPYNYPLNETFATLIPALIMGNVVILKPARYGMLLLEPLLEDFAACFPAGVVNVVYGDGDTTAGTLIRSGKIDVFAFIGSSRVANIIKKQHPNSNRLRSVLGLDAKNPAIIMPDADLPLAVAECVNGSLAFNGQRCTALKILFVHHKVAQAFIEAFCNEINKLSKGLPWAKEAFLTPLAEREKPAFIAALIKDAQQKGAIIANQDGGAQYLSYVHPAVITQVNAHMRLYHEEQFGPIVPIVTFEHPHEVIDYMVQSQFGQQVSIFSQHPETLGHLIDPLMNQVCRVNINCKCQRGPDVFPFNGRKDSAEGTLSVSDALRAFSIRTMVATRDTKSNHALISSIVREGHSQFLNTHYLF